MSVSPTSELAVWDAAMQAMVAQWSAVQQTVRSQRQQKAQTTVVTWQRTIQAMVAQQEQLKAEGWWQSGPADLLSVIGRQRRELTHCAVLAWLLTPTAPHGLGVRFLRSFLSDVLAVVPDDVVLGAAETGTEISRAHSRADLVIWMPDRTVVVEAKVDAAEQPQQCERLYLDWRSDSGAAFVFLTPSGRTPTTASSPEARAAWKSLSLRIVRDRLTASLADTGPAAGRAAAETYRQTLHKEFPSGA